MKGYHDIVGDGGSRVLENINFSDEKNPMLIGNIRIAAGGRDLYGRRVELVRTGATP